MQRALDITIRGFKNDSFRSYSTFVYLLRAHILNINTCIYVYNV